MQKEKWIKEVPAPEEVAVETVLRRRVSNEKKLQRGSSKQRSASPEESGQQRGSREQEEEMAEEQAAQGCASEWKHSSRRGYFWSRRCYWTRGFYLFVASARGVSYMRQLEVVPFS